MIQGKIRVLAIGIFRRGDEILVFEGYDPSKDELFYRPLGGAVEFGEYGHQALARELREELRTEVADLRYRGTLENLFVYDGRPGHEVVLVYEGTLAEAALYEQASMTAYEDDGTPFKALWKPLAEFGREKAPLYPDGLFAFLT
jgi:8-oxo-dGTP pyrophosphatase MutT (NUDIX family)